MHLIAAVLRFIFATVFILTLSFSQDLPTPPPPLLRFDVNLVQVDAVVTDGRGRHITDLTAADFEVSQAGKERRITHFEYVPAASKESPRGLAAASPAQLSREEVRRTLLFYIDDLHLSASEFALSRTALLRFIDENMRDNDVCGLVRTTGLSTISFTSDRRRLRYLVERMLWEPTPEWAQAPSQLYLRIGISINYLAALPGRKALVVIHRGAAEAPNVEGLRKLADVANRAGVTISAVDARGVSVSDSLPDNWQEASERGSIHPFDMLASTRLPRPLEYSFSMLGPTMLSNMTGGLVLHDQNDLHEAVETVADDSEGYYLLGWDPGPEVFQKMRSGAARYVPISIRVHRRGTWVRSRSGFVGVTGDIQPPPPVTVAQQVNDALFSPLRVRDIDVRLTSSFEGDYVESLVHIGPAGLTLNPKGDDCVTAATELLTSLRPLDVKSSDRMKLYAHRSTFEVCGATRDVVARQGFVSVIRTPVARPGPYEMAVVVRNVLMGEGGRPSFVQPRILGDCPTQPRPNAKRTLLMRSPDAPEPEPRALIERFSARTVAIGSALSFIEVPDLGKPAAALTGIRLAKENPPAEEAAGDFFFRPLRDPDPAIRVFRPGDAIAFRARRWGNCDTCAATMSIYFESKLLSEEPLRVPVGATTGVYRLRPDAPPGRYLMRISLANNNPRDRRPATQQWIDFSVER